MAEETLQEEEITNELALRRERARSQEVGDTAEASSVSEITDEGGGALLPGLLIALLGLANDVFDLFGGFIPVGGDLIDFFTGAGVIGLSLLFKKGARGKSILAQGGATLFELLPFADLFPTYTIAAVYSWLVGSRKKEQNPSPYEI